MKTSYWILISSTSHFQLGETGSFRTVYLEYLFFTHIKDHLVIFPGKTKRKLWAGVKDLISSRVPFHVTTLFPPWDPIFLNVSMSCSRERGLIKASPPDFPQQSFSQDMHDPGPFSLPTISVLPISLGNPGQLVISSSFICCNNEYPSMPWDPTLPALRLQCQVE